MQADGEGGGAISMARGDMSVVFSYLILFEDIVILATLEVIIKNDKNIF